MNILHVCICGQFNENYSYQDNLITKYHSLMGHDVSIIAPVLRFSDTNGYEEEVLPGFQLINNNIKLYRLPYASGINKKIAKKFRIYNDLSKTINQISPDFIFIHGVQFLDVFKVVKYLKQNPNIKVVADNHTDYYNSAKNWLSMTVLHKIIWKACAKKLESRCGKFFGVTPVRCDFLRDVYGIEGRKIDLLPLGADDEMLNFSDRMAVRNEVRKKYGIETKHFLIVSGGKIDQTKNVHLLLEAVKGIELENIRVVYFGNLIADIKEAIEKLTDSLKIINAGWLGVRDIYKLLIGADLIIFPGTHSVLWEQACATGVPCVFNRINGMEHVNVDGNCILLNGNSINEIRECILKVVTNEQYYSVLTEKAKLNSDQFLFSHIAQKSLCV